MAPTVRMALASLTAALRPLAPQHRHGIGARWHGDYTGKGIQAHAYPNNGACFILFSCGFAAPHGALRTEKQRAGATRRAFPAGWPERSSRARVSPPIF